MFESIEPRDGIPRFAGDRTIDPINGGDRDIADGDDLQYACIEQRSAPGANNDCAGPDAASKNPLCAADGTQPYFKAYPGLRHVRIAKDLGISGYVASICAKTYAPAIRGITDKVKAALNSQCLRNWLAPDEKGNVECAIVESLRAGIDGGKRCEELGRGLCTPGAEPCRRPGSDHPPTSAAEAAMQLNLGITVVASDGNARSWQTQAELIDGNVYVIGEDSPTPQKHLVCELEQLQGDSLQSCMSDPSYSVDPAKGGGWCFSSDPKVMPQCIKLGAPGTIRFIGGAEPRNGSELFTFCGGTGGC
jgi:hypothetical protein